MLYNNIEHNNSSASLTTILMNSATVSGCRPQCLYFAVQINNTTEV